MQKDKISRGNYLSVKAHLQILKKCAKIKAATREHVSSH